MSLQMSFRGWQQCTFHYEVRLWLFSFCLLPALAKTSHLSASYLGGSVMSELSLGWGSAYMAQVHLPSRLVTWPMGNPGIIARAVMNYSEHLCLQGPCETFFWKYTKNRTAESCGSYIYFDQSQVVLQKGCINLYFHQHEQRFLSTSIATNV